MYHFRKTLGATGDSIEFPIPQDGRSYWLLWTVEALVALVGTLQVQVDGAAKTTVTRKVGDVPTGAGTPAAADATAQGEFNTNLGAAGVKNGKIVFAAYTSGKVDVVGYLIPNLA
jgi:hypothetical protein